MARAAYIASKRTFLEDFISDQYIDKMIRGARENQIGFGPSEETSWRNNAQKISGLLTTCSIPDDVYVAFEFKNPKGGRIDCMLFGKDKARNNNIILLEMKQWSNETVSEICEDGDFAVRAMLAGGHFGIHAHPSKQALGYKNNIKNLISMVNESGNSLCGYAYCYNYGRNILPNDLFAERYEPVMRLCPLYGKGEKDTFSNTLHSLLDGGDGKMVFEKFTECKIAPTPTLINAVADIFNHRDIFTLVGDQITSSILITSAVKKAIQKPKEKTVIIVKGGPGTGKTLIALKILSNLAQDFPNIRTYFTTRSSSLRNALIQKLNTVNNDAADIITNIFQIRPHNYKENGIDVLFVDEAHRISNSSNDQSDRGNVYTYLPQTLSLIYSAKVCVFFIDDKQGVSKAEIGSSSQIKDFAEHYADRIEEYEKRGRETLTAAKERLQRFMNRYAQIVQQSIPSDELDRTLLRWNKRRIGLEREANRDFQFDDVHFSKDIKIELQEATLTTQFRCDGCDGYLDWLDAVFYDQDGTEKAKRIKFSKNYKFKICNSPSELEKKIRELNAPKENPDQVARLVAGWCWSWSTQLMSNGDLNKDVKIGDWEMPWETNGVPPVGDFVDKYPPTTKAWAVDPRGINQVGTVYTVQGFEMDYIGVILGPDIFFNPNSNQIEIACDKTIMRNREEATSDLVKNIYRVLMSRGTKGCFVYCCDQNLSEYLKSLL